MHVTLYSLQCQDQVDSIMTCMSTILWNYCLSVVDAKTTPLAANGNVQEYERWQALKLCNTYLNEQNGAVTICPKTSTFQAMSGWKSAHYCHCKYINTYFPSM